MDLIDVYCPRCKAIHEVEKNFIGQQGLCFSCNHEFTISLPDDISEHLDSSRQKATVKHTLNDIRDIWDGSINDRVSASISIRRSASVSVDETSIRLRERRLFAPDIPGSGSSEDSDFELLEAIGEGGMGIVFRARQISVNRPVALKMIHPNSATKSSEKQSFLSEAIITAALDNHKIVPIHDLGKGNDGTLFYAMKEIKGVPWEQVLSRKTLQENLDILMNVCDAIAYAHAQGVIHRDLKPQNVMLGDYGEVYVMDWGIATRVETDYESGKVISLSRESGRAGTPAYMAPEMAQCNQAMTSTRSDIYLLGAILYEVLAGYPPHNHESVYSSIYMAAENIILPTDSDSELHRIALKAMETSPANRYKTVKMFQEAIRQCMKHMESISLTETAISNYHDAEKSKDYKKFNHAMFGFEEALKHWPENESAKDGLRKVQLAYAESAMQNDDLDHAETVLDSKVVSHQQILQTIQKKRKQRQARQTHMRILVASLQFVGLLVLVIVTIAAIWIARERQHALAGERKAQQLLDQVKDEKQKAQQEEQRAKQLLARIQQEQQRAQSALKRAEESKKQADQEKKHAYEAEATAKNAGKKAVLARKQAEQERLNALQAKRQAERALIDVKKANIKVSKLSNQEMFAYQACIQLAQEELDEKDYAAVQNTLGKTPKDIRNWEWGYLTQRYLDEAPASIPFDMTVQSLCWSRKGKRLILISPDKSIASLDIDEKRSPIKLQVNSSSLVYSPDCDFIALSSGNKINSLFWDGSSTTSPAKSIKAHDSDVVYLNSSPDHEWLISSAADGTVKLWDFKSLKLKSEIGAVKGQVRSAFLSDDKHLLGVINRQNRLSIWQVITHRKLYDLVNDNHEIVSAFFSKNGKLLFIISPSDVIQVRDAKNGKLLSRMSDHNATFYDAILIPGSPKQLLSCGSNGIALWDIPTGTIIRAFGKGMDVFRKLILTPDKSQLIACGNDRKLRIWSMKKASTHPQVTSKLPDVTTVDFFGNGSLIALGCRENRCLLWDIINDSEQKAFPMHTAIEDGATVAATREHLAIANGQKLTVWVHQRARKLKEFEFKTPITSVLASSLAKRFYVNLNFQKIAVIPISGEVKMTYLPVPENEKNVFAVSPNGRFVTVAGRNMTTWDLKTMNSYSYRSLNSKITAASYFPDSKRIAIAHDNGKIAVLAVKTHNQYSSITNNAVRIKTLKISPDSKRIIAGTENCDLVLWDIKTGMKVFSEKAHRNPICSLDISSDGKTICTTDGKEMKFWHAAYWKINLPQ